MSPHRSIPLPRPLWRWALFVAVDEVSRRTGWAWTWRIWERLIAPEWLGWPGAKCGEELPWETTK